MILASRSRAIPARFVSYDAYTRHKDIFFPRYWDQTDRMKGKDKLGKVLQYNHQDPLYFQDETKHLTGGMENYIHQIREKRNYLLPQR